MDQMVERTIKDCVPCQCTVRSTTTEPIMPTDIPKSAWHTIELDFSSRTPTKEYLLAVYDQHSRKNIQKLAADMTTATAIRICKNFFSKYGIPKVIKSDNGPAFKSHDWANFAKRYNVVHQKITPLHPEANAGAERTMACTNKRIRCAKVAGTHWKVELSNYLKRYNQTPHSSTGFSPNMLLLGSDQCDILPNICPRTLTSQITGQAIENDALAKAKMKRYADTYQHTKHREFKMDDPVLHAWDRAYKHLPFFDPYPYRITSINGSMLTAARSNHLVTRNSRHFKIISELCYEKACNLIKKVPLKSATLKFIIYPRKELVPYQNEATTPPPTPNMLLDVIRPPGSPQMINNNQSNHLNEEIIQQAGQPTARVEGHSMERRSSGKQGRLSYINAYRMFPKASLTVINEHP